MPITAKARSDDSVHQVKFDAEPWFVRASDQEILSLAGIGWSDNYVADAVVEFFDGKRHYEEITDLFEYVAAHPTIGRRDTPGFQCSAIDQAAALRWVGTNRPHLFPACIAAAMNEAEGVVTARAYGADRPNLHRIDYPRQAFRSPRNRDFHRVAR